MNRPLRISCACICVVMMTGSRCAKIAPAVEALPAMSAPDIPLRLASSQNFGSIDVTIDDHRPDYERLYYPGTCEPRRWHDAVSFVPMESFASSIEDQFRQRTAAAIASISPETDCATVTLTSFQLAFDHREDMGAKVQRIIRINRHAPLTGAGSFKEQTAAFIEASFDEYSASVSEVARLDRTTELTE